MPQMPSKFANSWVNQEISRLLDPVNKPDYRKMLRKLKTLDADTPCASVVLTDAQDPKTARAYREALAHMKVHWYEDGTRSYWPKIADKKFILRQANIELLSRLVKVPNSVSITWVCASMTKSHQDFEIVVNDQPEQLSMIILTPMPNLDKAVYNETETENLFVFSTKQEAENIVAASARIGLDQPKLNSKQCRPVDEVNGIWRTEVFGAAMY